MSKTISGWIFDVYPASNGVTIWFIDRQNVMVRCWKPFRPSFFLHLHTTDIQRAEALAARSPVPISCQRTQRRELFSNALIDVLQVFVHDPLRVKEAVWYYEKFFPHFAFFNSDIPVPQLFFYDTGLFPLARGEYECDDDGQVRSWIVQDSRDTTEYELPSFSIMSVRNANVFVPPKYQKHLQLEIEYDGCRYALEQENAEEVLEAFNWHLYRYDPDIILTAQGDASLLPLLTSLAQRYKMTLLLNRDRSAQYMVSKESSFFQYGKIVHKDGAFELAGRWHIDVENSFAVAESELDGLFELARTTQMPVQRQSRASIGTGLSSLQLSWAYQNNVLIPSKKREPEDFKSAATLLLADRGGLIFSPLAGFHEDVAELDFISMYPSIMVNHNVSPETVNCHCCHNNAVPELGYTICQQREGLVAATLRSVVAKRAYYKKKRKEWKGKDEQLYRRYDRRQNALKWMLVSCFGYLGYKNARYGRIEAHESVNAFSRDAILAAKEVAESHGFRLLHAIIDCVWVHKDGATEHDYQELVRDISARVGITISLEGIYRWVLFPTSKQDLSMSTTNHYVGWYTTGEMKMRGIEARRRDSPAYIKAFQKTLLDQMGTARTIHDIEQMIPQLLESARNGIALLRSGKVNPMDLVIRRHITKEADEYTNNSISAVVTKLVESLGIHLSPGESIEFIILDQSGKRKPEKAKPLALYAFEDGYDIDAYTEFALKAVETLLEPFGYTVDRLKEEFGLGKKKTAMRRLTHDTLELEFLPHPPRYLMESPVTVHVQK